MKAERRMPECIGPNSRVDGSINSLRLERVYDCNTWTLHRCLVVKDLDKEADLYSNFAPDGVLHLPATLCKWRAYFARNAFRVDGRIWITVYDTGA
jgi:hypothetical protein